MDEEGNMLPVTASRMIKKTFYLIVTDKETVSVC